MKLKKKAYSTRSVFTGDRAAMVAALRRHGGGTLGADVAKEEIVVCLRYRDGSFERPWKIGNHRQGIENFRELYQELSAAGALPVGLESTGTYGDVFRHQLTAAGCEVHRVGNTAVADYAEIFDGVPSQHDGKDAAMIAELVAIGKSQPWPWQEGSANDHELERWVDWLDIHQAQEQQWVGRLEALLRRYWPELTTQLSFRTASLVWLLEEYGGPRWLSDDPAAARRLQKFGGPLLAEAKVAAIVAEASRTAGVPMSESERRLMQSYAGELRRCREEQAVAERELRRLTVGHAPIQSFVPVVGLLTACVLWVDLGDVRNYTSGAAYRKAMGLNLKVRSSGKWTGQLKLTKRGSSRVRRWLYFAALRWSQVGSVARWYEAKKARDQGKGGRALTGIMRRLACALYQVGTKGVAFDVERMFPGRPLPPLTVPSSGLSSHASVAEASCESRGVDAAQVTSASVVVPAAVPECSTSSLTSSLTSSVATVVACCAVVAGCAVEATEPSASPREQVSSAVASEDASGEPSGVNPPALRAPDAASPKSRERARSSARSVSRSVSRSNASRSQLGSAEVADGANRGEASPPATGGREASRTTTVEGPPRRGGRVRSSKSRGSRGGG